MKFAARHMLAACAIVGVVAPAQAQLPIPNVFAGAQTFSDEYGNGSFVEGYFQIASRQGLSRWYYNHGVVPSYARFEMTTLLRGGPDGAGYGIAFARPSRDVSQWCTFTIDSDGHYRVVRWGGEAAIPWTSSPFIHTGIGARNTIAVEVRGTQMTFYINGNLVNSWTADRDVSGNFGVSVGQGVEVRFEAFSVASLGGGAGVPVSAMPSKGGPTVAAPLAGGGLLFTEDFSGFAVADDAIARSEYAEGGLLVNARSGMTRWMFGRGLVQSNVRISVTAHFRGGPTNSKIGFAFGRPSRDEATWLAFHYQPDGQYYMEGYGAANNLGPVFAAPVVRGYNATNILTAEVRGAQVSLYINGQFVTSYTATRDATGYVGVTATAGAQVLFTNFRVERLN